MDHTTGNEFNDASLLNGDSQPNFGVGDEGFGDSTEEETARYEQLIRELNEFEEAPDAAYMGGMA